MFSHGELPVIPLWIDGHAYLTITERFLLVSRAQDNAPLRRIPVCGAREVEYAMISAHASRPGWRGLQKTERLKLLVAVGNALEGFSGHFSRLISEESGAAPADANAEVAEVIGVLRSSVQTKKNAEFFTLAGVQAIAGRFQKPLSSALGLAVPALISGCPVVLKSPPAAPSALFALAELTARCAWPAGVFNLVHGDETTCDAFRVVGLALQ